MYPFKVSLWPSAKTTSANQRTDIEIKTFDDLYHLFDKVSKVEHKIDQQIITRRWQKTRARDNEKWNPPYLITLDFDSSDKTPEEVHDLLCKEEINHFIITTWTHKTIETPQKKNNGKNCFKVFTEVVAKNAEELLILTKGLGALVDKFDINKNDDISAGIFLGGVHPEYFNEYRSFFFKDGSSIEDTEFYLKANCPPETEEVKRDPLDDFEMWDKTQGQKWTPERIKRALSTIKYEEVDGFTKMSVWYSIGYSLHSTGEDDLFELWDEWCLENCAEEGVYNREENEKFWAKQIVPDKHKNLCTLATLWHLEKLFKSKQTKSEIRQSAWTFFDILARETPQPIEFLIQDLLVRNSIGFLVGEGGVGKSSLCLEIAKAISSGRPLFDDERFTTVKGSVAIINKEDSLNKVHNQIHNMVELDGDRIFRKQNSAYADFTDDLPNASLPKEEIEVLKDRWANVVRPNWAQSNIRLTDQEGEDLEALGAILSSLKSLKQELKETRRPELELVIFDPLNMFHGGDQNSQKDMSFMFSAFQQIQKELDVCLLIVHHKNKSAGFSGSHTIRDSGRFMWYLQHKNNDKESKFIELYVDKNNDAKSNYVVLDFIRTEKGLLDVANINNEKVEKDEQGEENA